MLIDDNRIYKETLGRWYTIRLQNEIKSILLINMYQIPDRSNEG